MSSLKKTLVIKLDPKDPDKRALAYCAKEIREGRLVAFPTETVYGIAANLLDKKAIARLYKVKKRPRRKPFTVHIARVSAMARMGCKVTREAKRLIDKFWPGPLTIILRSRSGAKIGFRMPSNRIASELIRISKVPIVAPSANISGSRAPARPEDVLRGLRSKIDLLIDGGRTDEGIESTVVDLTVTPPKVLREGAISRRELFASL
ncbi:MAG: L-threonylcarbamoyladenylate synthase [Candidatus Omnitrophota bacterium]|nr:L-threonylcarbamoyladenylate synthase [Candidatus Omnitrophota bacterium]